MLADFYGNVRVPPTAVEHNRPALDTAIAAIRAAMTAHDLRDLVVAVERTGRYHHVVQHAFAAASFEVRVVHPFATKQFRQPQDPGNKTDDTDLVALHRAAVNGFALTEPVLDETWRTLQLLIRHRRDLVGKSTILCCPIREHVEAALPGFAACFDNVWDRACAWHLLEHFASAAALHAAGLDGLCASLRQAGIRFQRRTLAPVLDGAAQAAPGDLAAVQHHRIALALNADRLRKTQEIQALEGDIAGRLVQTPYVLLLSFPGLNVVSAADFAGEMGPLGNYATGRAITGRAGLRPSRYQSDKVDHANGPRVRCCNHKLRAAILGIADNLVPCNHHFQALAHRWKADGKDPRHTRVRVGMRFCRIAFHMVAGGQVFRHPAVQGRHYILHKLTAFQDAHGTPMPALLHDLEAAVGQLPRPAYAAEAGPLHEELQRIDDGRRRGPQPLADILPLVLARLGVGAVQSTTSGKKDSH
jgi:transposase